MRKLTAAVLFPLFSLVAKGGSGPSYNFEVQPILAAKCFACHGPDEKKRKGDLQLDVCEAAVGSGAIVPGDPAASGLIERIISTDEDEVMPPPSRHMPVTAGELEILKQWIAGGATYQKHWAFDPPAKPELPALGEGESPIDGLLRESWEKQGLTPSPEAPKEEWLRRVTFALTGLPPTPDELVDFAADTSTAARAKVVDRLLASPRFGEKMAIDWLDVARYADTYGRHEDAESELWPWRDWVIRSFNENLPYNEFLRWQTAGDLLPEPTQDQLVATAFNRLCVQSNESGADPEEYRWDQVFDRVQTNATAVLGLTMHCARCHDHKSDPLLMKEYYEFASFFANIDEFGIFARFTNATPAPSAFVYQGDQRSRHERALEAVKKTAAEHESELLKATGRYTEWLKTNRHPGESGIAMALLAGRVPHSLRTPVNYFSFDTVEPETKAFMDDINPGITSESKNRGFDSPGKIGNGCFFDDDKRKRHSFPGVGAFSRDDAFSFSFWIQCRKPVERGVILHRSRGGLDAAHRGYEIVFEDGLLTATLANFYPANAIRIRARQPIDFSSWRHVAMTYDGSSDAAGFSLFLDGQRLDTEVVRNNLYRDINYRDEWGDFSKAKIPDAPDEQSITFKLGDRTLDSPLLSTTLDELRIYDCCLSPGEISILAGQSAADAKDWFPWFAREIDGPARAAAANLSEARKQINQISAELREIMVMREMPGQPRQVPMLQRGDFRSPGQIVQPAIPAVLGKLAEGKRPDRKALADWYASPDNPLTSRVQVNRIWKMFFGTGFVATQEDFGTQGTVPSHPHLLDWLAVHFVESGWDNKALCREIALSAAYARSSLPADPSYREKDPSNRYLARGPRLRLPAEALRDAALASSGLLHEQLGGPSVKPPQPEGLWEDTGTQHVYTADTGEKARRRSLYTFWRRTCPPPMLSVFDAPTREFCLARRTQTMTPLQSLALANEPGFLDAARALSVQLAGDFPSADGDESRVRRAFLLLGSREPTEAQSRSMTELLQTSRAHYNANPGDAANLLLSCGKAHETSEPPPAEVAATIVLVRALFGSELFLSSR
ncbi:MAG: DUF1553 domain-containing protein [Verrucomicrobiales bacterium]